MEVKPKRTHPVRDLLQVLNVPFLIHTDFLLMGAVARLH